MLLSVQKILVANEAHKLRTSSSSLYHHQGRESSCYLTIWKATLYVNELRTFRNSVLDDTFRQPHVTELRTFWRLYVCENERVPVLVLYLSANLNETLDARRISYIVHELVRTILSAIRM
jgi:hypothetical protein